MILSFKFVLIFYLFEISSKADLIFIEEEIINFLLNLKLYIFNFSVLTLNINKITVFSLSFCSV